MDLLRVKRKPLLIWIVSPYFALVLIDVCLLDSTLLTMLETVFALCPLLFILRWYWNIGVRIGSKKEEKQRTDFWFKRFFFTLIILLIIQSTIILYSEVYLNIKYKQEPWVALLGTLISMVVFCYIIYYAATSFYKNQDSDKPYNTLQIVLLLFYYPIGIWLLQPRINRMVEKNS